MGGDLMNVGIKESSDESVIRFYNQYYDVLSTPDYSDATRILKPNHGLLYLGDKNRKICRFCGRKEPDVSFKLIAHAFPESIGNKALATYYECDACNQKFGRTIENQYNIFFGLFHTLMNTNGQKLKFKTPAPEENYNINQLSWESISESEGRSLVFRQAYDNNYSFQINEKTKEVTYTYKIPSYTPISVFMCLVKMAVSVIPQLDLYIVEDTINWMKSNPTCNFYSNGKKLFIRFKMIPGFNVTKYPHFIIYKRKNTCFTLPYLLFNLTYGCLSLLIEVPTKNAVDTSIADKNMPFTPLPFYTSSEWIEDFSESATMRNRTMSVNLNYDNSEVIERESIEL